MISRLKKKIIDVWNNDDCFFHTWYLTISSWEDGGYCKKCEKIYE